MKNFCALPFDHVMVRTNGQFDICCQHRTPVDARININKHDHDHWLNSDYVKSVRHSFELDQRHPGCDRCWQKEDQGFDSLRVKNHKEYSILPNRSDRAIKNVEIDLGNLCNLRCIMCSENSSSAILSENIKLGINKITQAELTWNDTGYHNLQKILAQKPYVLNIRGGEPLYNKRLLEIVSQISTVQARDMVLHITTNATVWHHQWQKVLEKFRLVRFMFSIDAVGALYEYIRYPASWSLVEQNVTSIMALSNVQCLVNCVGQNLNISSIGDVIEWCKTNSLYLTIDPLVYPDYLQIQNLPQAQKDLSMYHLDTVLGKSLEPHLQKFIYTIRNLLQQTEFDPHLWQEFVTNMSMRDRLRGNSFKQFIKESPC